MNFRVVLLLAAFPIAVVGRTMKWDFKASGFDAAENRVEILSS